MKIYGYAGYPPESSEGRRRIIHRSVHCGALERTGGHYDATVWLDKASGKITRDKYSDDEWELCRIPTCTPEKFFDSSLGACSWEDHELFFPPNMGGTDAYAPAREICGRCVIVDECLQFAIDQNLHFGMYGGMSPNERRNYVANLRKKALA